MSGLWTWVATVYVAGVVWGLIVIDARPAMKVGLALVWPLGPIAFAITLTILVAASFIAFPMFGITVLAVAGVIFWMLSR